MHARNQPDTDLISSTRSPLKFCVAITEGQGNPTCVRLCTSAVKIKMLTQHHIDKVQKRSRQIRKSKVKSIKDLFYFANTLLIMAAKSRIFRMTTCLSLLLAVFAVHTPRSSPATDPDVVQYLTEVFDRVKGSGRKPVNEELNLLPDENEGFANMVRCFSADHIGEYCGVLCKSILEFGIMD